jgi:hypothetical protein
MIRISPVTETVIEAACKARHSPQKWGRTLKNTDMVGWINSQRAEMRMILTAAFDAAGHAQTPDLEATVSRIMRIRNGMIPDGDAEDLIRKEIGALVGSHVQNSKQWQPIETAPKGVRLLLFSPGHKISDDPDERTVIITSTTRDWNWATHWMPLPAPPALSDTSTDRTSK